MGIFGIYLVIQCVRGLYSIIVDDNKLDSLNKATHL